MKKSKRKKSKKRITNNYLGMAVISVVVLLLLGGLAMKSHSLRNRIAYYDAQAELKQQISDEKERTKEIDKRTEYMQTDEYAAEVARDRLGLVKDNEIVFEEEK